MDLDGDGTIDFEEFCRGFGVASGSQEQNEEYHPEPEDLEFTPAQMEQMQTIFQVVDADGSGYIDVDEMSAAMLQIGKELSREEVEEIMKKLDDDGNGRIDFNEFLRGMGPFFLNLPPTHRDQTEDLSQEEIRQIERAFKRMDADNSGTLSPEEVFLALRELGKSSRDTSLEEVQGIFKQLDKDGDGAITLEEFKAGMAKFENAREFFTSTAPEEVQEKSKSDEADTSSSADAEIFRLRSLNDALMARNDTLIESEKENQKILQSMHKLRTELLQLRKTCENSKKLQEENDTFKLKLQELEEQDRSRGNQIRELKTEIENLRKSNIAHERNLEENSDLNLKFQDEKKKLSGELKELKLTLENFKREREEETETNKKQIQDISSQNFNLKTKISELEESEQLLKEDVKRLEEEKSEPQPQGESLADELSQGEAVRSSEEIQQLQLQVEHLQLENSRLVENSTRSAEERKILESNLGEMEDLKKKNLQLENSEKDLRTELKKKNQVEQTLQDEIKLKVQLETKLKEMEEVQKSKN
eukprot:TRINITY_DN259_c4_g1_i7.p1 TRINITY_DN259_c4_g1~~TRINITY_DN259_c4_g1_i7.p1  ORF type:complete len:600 (+),score=296.33 TRINITY_DN259_c4_g1_i7:202-1800(+)